MDPIFSPSLHRQRHQFVVDFVRKSKPRKVADLGCGECKLLKQLRFQRNVDLLVGVDINGTKIKKKMYGLAPLSTDYLQPTYDQLRIELYQGSVTEKDARLRGFDLVTSIELIEHLRPTDLELFPSVVFGYMSPASVIVSTPNSEFNRLLPGLTGFRHSDHKFEWNRSEFRSWLVNAFLPQGAMNDIKAHKVCSDYGYRVEFTGVGEAPQHQRESVGFCSQIGVFHRLEAVDGSDEEEVFSYTMVYSVNYPSLHDNNTFHRVLVSEVLYQAEQMKNSWMEEKTGRTNCVLPHRWTDQGDLEGTGRAEKLDCPADYCGRSVGEHQESLWTNDAEQQESDVFLLGRFVLVPLDLLWSCCPRIAELSGSLGNLRRLLMDQPQVKLSQDGSSLLVECGEQDPEEADSHAEEDERPPADHCSDGAEPEEDWEANV